MGNKAQLTNSKDRYEQALDTFGRNPEHYGMQFLVAICWVKLDNYETALHHFDLALRGFVGDRRFWHGTSQPNWLVDAYMLANQPGLYPQVLQEVESYKLDYRGESPVALYAYAMVNLLSGMDKESESYVPGLLAKPKYKDTFAMGYTIQAIVNHDQSAFDVAFDNLLKAHRGMAKFGGLRETPEGFLCLPAMSLAKIALGRGIDVTFESEYLSREYLDYLLQHQSPCP